jgi:hypothetical protein
MDWIDGGGDSYSHFLLARDAAIHPENFLHHWGKPFFTLLAFPFAQLGIKGVEVFNALCYLLGAYSAFSIAQNLKYKHAWAASLFTLFAPIVYITAFSALTEPLASFIIILGVLLYTQKRFVLGSILLSFIIMVRTEAFVFFPVWAAFLFWVRAYKAIPFLAIGFVVYSLAGWQFYDDILWVITKQPYPDTTDIYGTGDFWHFADSYLSITHKVPGFALLFGILFMLVSTIKNKFKHWTFEVKVEWMILASSGVFFFAHSYAWWSENAASAGLLRVMAVIIPLIAVIGVKGLNWFLVSNKRNVQMAIAVFMVFISIKLVYRTWQMHHLPVATHPDIACFNNLTYPINEAYKQGQRIAYYHPYVGVRFGVDFRNTRQALYFFESGRHRLAEMQSGDLLIWDNQFWVVEGRTAKEDLDLSGYEKVDSAIHPRSETRNAEVEVWRKL